jgi:putative MATE family efflux protein|tara:strand:- start:4384 stop:5736 length:1353 start_codon:yes stop_codon:yes gene_type:complete
MSLHNSDRIQLILNAPIYSILFKLATPNMISVLFTMTVAFSEPFFAGQLGIVQLASVAIIFPFASLAAMVGAGAVGGGVVSALSRSIGKNDLERANSVIWHSTLIYFTLSAIFFIVFVFFSKNLFNLIGADNDVVDKAVRYSRIFFGLGPLMWLYFLMVSIYRGCGDYQSLARINITTGLFQLFFSGALSLGWWFLPGMGLNGIALSIVLPQGFAGLYMLSSIFRGRFEISFKISNLNKEIFIDIMKVGGVASLNSISIAATMLVTTIFISKYGTEAIAGYGVCARLEQTLIPLAFGVGGVLTSTVGTNFGAKQFSRARNISWLGALIIAILAGIIGMTVFIFPSLWLGFFTTNPEAYIIGTLYLGIVGPFFPIFAFGKTLYFASQGTGNMIIPILGGITRLVIVSIVGFTSYYYSLEIKFLFFGIGIAMSSVGLILFINMFSKTWRPEK